MMFFTYQNASFSSKGHRGALGSARTKSWGAVQGRGAR
jgi:hypothetical protein